MVARHEGFLAASEGAVADIAWIVVLVMCCVLILAPFVLWYGGIRKPRNERAAARSVGRVEEPADERQSA